jgi:phosphoglycerol transferase MdoB-like AlkP superfamily enzyme
MDFNKIKTFCKKFRISIGIILILIGVLLSNPWFYLGVIPLIAGLLDFCPLCIITKKCDIEKK